MTVTTSSVNILISSTPTIMLQGQDSRENNPVIIVIAAAIVPILLLLLIVCIIVTSYLIVYHQRQKKRKSNLAVLNDDNLGYFKQSHTLNQTSTIVNEVPCDDISNPVYEGNINYIYLVMVHVITIMTDT